MLPDADTAASRFNIERTGHVYSRLTNPTNAVLEERISALEGGVGAIATASGQAATHLGIATLMGAGSHIVSSQSIYGGTHNLMAYTLPRFGVETTFVDPRDPDAFRSAIRPETRLIFGETLGNPGVEVLNIPVIAEIAHETVEYLSHTPRIHVSLDMDCLDPAAAPGVGTPVTGGLSYREAHLLMEILAETAVVGSLDVVEINPILDHGNSTAKLAVELVASLLGNRIL